MLIISPTLWYVLTFLFLSLCLVFALLLLPPCLPAAAVVSSFYIFCIFFSIGSYYVPLPPACINVLVLTVYYGEAGHINSSGMQYILSLFLSDFFLFSCLQTFHSLYILTPLFTPFWSQFLCLIDEGER